MMQLLCNGVRLDLAKNAKFTFQKSNPLFAFDDLKCERTTEFSLPDTPTNNRVFAIAKDPALYGDGMRHRYPCEMQDGTVVKQGYLYVSSYDRKSYKAIFVTGELLELQRIRDLGKLRDIIVNSENVEYGGAAITPSAGLSTVWGNVDHMRKSGTIHPSSLLQILSERVTTQNNLRAVALPSVADGLRVIPAKVRSLMSEGMLFETTADPSKYSTGAMPGVVYDTHFVGRTGSGLEDFFQYSNEVTRDYSLGTGNPRSGYVILIRPKVDMVIKFPEDFPANVFAVSSVAAGQADFLGGYSFDIVNGSIVRSGQPLAGREIGVNATSAFLLVDERDRTKVDDYYGWYFSRSLSLRFEVRAAKENAEDGEIVRLQDNLPDVTYIELLKAIAAISGKALNYTDADGITFDDVDTATWSRVDITKRLLALGNVSRRFGDYAQENVIRFDSGEHVGIHVTTSYHVDNDNIAAEKDLQTIPFSEGDMQFDAQGRELVFINADDGEDDKDTIAQSGTPSKLMQVTLEKNAGIQSLTSSSTSIDVRVKMSLAEYESLAAKTTILCQGILYVWTSARWSGGVADISLSKA